MPEKIREVVLESGIAVKPVYGPEDVGETALPPEIGKPGEFPFTRGIHPLMYRARPWTMRQYAGFGTPVETNERFKFLIGNGQNALNWRLICPLRWALIPTIRWPKARWAAWAWRSIPWPIWKSRSTASRSTRSASR